MFHRKEYKYEEIIICWIAVFVGYHNWVFKN